MADNLTVKLGADTSEFRGAISDAASSVQNTLGTAAGEISGSKFVKAFEHHLLGGRLLVGALSTALGLNFEEIAKNLARAITGVSKEEEESLKKLAETSDVLREKSIKAMQETLSQEQLYQLKLVERDQLEKKLADNAGKTTKDQLQANLDRIALIDKEEEIKKIGGELDKARNEEGLKYLKFASEIKRKDAEAEAVEAKKRGETQKKNLLEEEKLQGELKKLKYEAMTPDKQLEELLKEQLSLQKDINFAKANGGTNLQAEVDLQRVSNEIAAKKLEIERQTTEELKAQTKERMNASGNLGVAKAIGGFATYNTPEQQAAYEKQLIDSARADTQQEIDSLRAQIDAYTKSGSSLGKYEIPALQQRLQALQGREGHLQDFVFNPNYQDKAGQGLFAQQVATIGDPLKLQQKQTDTLQAVATGVNDLNTRLHNAGFGTGK